MSSPVAVAAVTAALAGIVREVVDAQSPGTKVTTLPPGLAYNAHENRLNLFLYQVTRDTAWSNADWTSTTRPGESGPFPLALTLHYLLTPFVGSRPRSDPVDDLLLGWAMGALHDHPFLSPIDARHWLPIPQNDLDQQLDSVRITFEPLTLDDLTRLWTVFQADYRVSAGYEASVVLIDGRAADRIPLPVLTVGPNDQGPVADPAVPPSPVLQSIELLEAGGDIEATGTTVATAEGYVSAGRLMRPGDTLILHGQLLDGATKVRLTAPDRQRFLDIDLPAADRRADRLRVIIPDDMRPVGIHTVSVAYTGVSGSELFTNAIPLVLAPLVLLPVGPATSAAGITSVSVSVRPYVGSTLPVRLLLGETVFEHNPLTSTAGTVTFALPGVSSGKHQARLRVGRFDSASFIVDVP